ncbi:hypothetical protein N7535_002975 [Penicillium sp. DV-2018c]|nr:hypothetical protein N7461_001339 [Penicillium sp. DV-2018c]KAJ5576049.1 hypothetical protein N7535_002975 [Penicillium sp. DV-2018c]
MEFIRAASRLRLIRIPLAGKVYLSPTSRHVRFNTTAASVPSGIVLRDYQEESIQSVLKYVDEGHRRLGISLATGAGKTQVIFTQLIDRIPPRDARASKTMIIVHRRELVEQAARHCRLAYPSKIVEIEMGTDHATGAGDIIIASVQTLSRGRIDKFDPSEFKLVLVDEAHHIVAKSYRAALRHFGLNEPSANGPVLVGVSATFSRFDGLKLGAAIDHIVYHKDYIDMIADKWLSDAIFTTVKSGANLSKVKKDSFGDFAVGSLSEAVNTTKTNEITVRAWMANAEGRKSTLVFCVDVEHARELTKAFRDHGVDARYITAGTAKRTRAEELQAFQNQEFPVLLNCGLFTEGTDIPNIDCVLLARPTKSRNLLIQMIGRGLRLYPGKENCHIIDMVSSLETGVLSAPTLFGLHPDEVLDKASVEDMSKRAESIQAERSHEVAESYDSADTDLKLEITTYDSIYDLLGDIQSERHIRSISPHSWVRVGDDKYILAEKSGWITIEKEHNMYTAHYVMKFMNQTTQTTQYARPRQIATGEDLEAIVRSADTYASTKFDEHYIASWKPWRQAPATSGQLRVLDSSRLRKGVTMDSQGLTRGRAADMITKLKHGGKKRFRDLEALNRKKVRQGVDLAELRKREEVKVGPLGA